ncbi:bifunctional oligoribonuclease/PAP phosphatase NrnA [Mycoplasmopsis cynos]|uniref:DHH family phosphoesterase n=1 Tax=Mycoplasmopsis cynos TaxID=171284 RepID=UPI0024CB8FAE|nr:bifunctional oligoribonuclease/PAP phosphatase NrnA [Mycoplasmopsis cynos]WAM04038.1 bifunctional oligoribonuclease/PAP phosphatase NrnA [Mycoplasmopsis cynos]WAM10423.1 bifunctional oligoribonuclease/PAP phosphatase NrnA [Mycoplasmopsis cynos]
MQIGDSKVAIDAIQKYQNIIIFHHIRPDGDCLGSQFGLAELIKTNFPDKTVYTVGNNQNVYNFMNYTFDDPNTINYENSLGIVVDASSGDRIQNSEILYQNKTTAKLRIDHHPNDADIMYEYNYIDEKFVAAAEMVAQIAYDAKWKITQKAAYYIYLGIFTDSGGFMRPDTSRRTHILVAYLLESGFDPQKIIKELNKRSLNDIKITGYILSNFIKEQNVLYFIANKEFMQKFNLNVLQASDYVNVLANIEDNHCWALFVEQEDNTIRARIRSNGSSMIPVAKYFNGGGHDDRGGCILKFKNEIKDVIEKLNQAIITWKYEKGEL